MLQPQNINEKSIDELVKNSLTDPTYNNDERYQNLRGIIDNVKEKIKTLGEENQDKLFNSLVMYGKIWLSSQSQELGKRVNYDENNSEQNFLLSIGLVSKRLNEDFNSFYLEVSNPIYEKMLNLYPNEFQQTSYIEETLPNIRGYGQKYGMWLITQENKYLLSSEEVLAIINHLAGEKLSEEEHKYLISSISINFQL
ncbi:hypothetical protein [Geminocystis sp. GBBB08]|uniref:hypothetical protein n=1 Tax=Geminocystis sp. GBBB08 TaxID=2604140 RepID=UPI0027E392B8|nr:hypothetical protein [Geminocystis sp. GBBB08]MBL1211063.1 hypothetical protein [Geminocystis sp. GBBB08]